MYVIPDIGLDEQIEQGWFDLCRFDVWTVLAHNLAAKAGVLIDKAEKDLLVWKQMEIVRVGFWKEENLNASFVAS